MPHAQNIIEFKKAFACGSDLVETYCRLIAIELKLSDIAPTKSHDIINKLQNLSKTSAGLPHAGALNTRISELKAAFSKIHVESKKGTGTLPSYSYPTIRYTRYLNDWTSKTTPTTNITALNNIAKNTIATLKALGRGV